MEKETVEGIQHLTDLVLKNTLAIFRIEEEIGKIYDRLAALVDFIPEKKGE